MTLQDAREARGTQDVQDAHIFYDYAKNPLAKAKESQVISGKNWRITLITDSLVRLEWSENGGFVDAPTQTVVRRNFEAGTQIAAEKSQATADEKSAQKSPIKSETPHLPPDQMDEFVNMMQVYEGAMYEISTKLEILDGEFQVRFSHNPVHHMERRLKSVHSIFEKLRRRNLSISTRSIRDNLFDVAGIRVICNYRDDVYAVAQYLSKQTDIQVLQVKDYIKNPKPNGYRSLHVIYAVPVFLSSGAHYTPVEVQFRTIAMDYWASLEHALRYKADLPDAKLAEHSKTRLECAQNLQAIEAQMQGIHRDINGAPRVEDAPES